MKSKFILFAFLAACGTLVACDNAVDYQGGDTAEDVDAAEVDSDGLDDGTDDGETIDPNLEDKLGPITDLRIDGLDGECDVAFDDNEIPSIKCESDADAAAVLGYLHARNRFLQMDIRRRLVQGRLSELVVLSEATLPIDQESRALFTNRDGRPIEEVLVENASPKTMELLEAYSNGVNAWIEDFENDRNGAKLQAEYSFFAIADVADAPLSRWTPEDSMATVAALVESLTNDASTDISYGRQLNIIAGQTDLPAGIFADFFSPRPISDSVILPSFTFDDGSAEQPEGVQRAVRGRAAAANPGAAAALEAAQDRLELIHSILQTGPDRGSNNWVVSGSQTANGNALFSNDPHLALSNPSIWYIAHMDATPNGDYHAAGMTFAGLPWVIIGQNENVAWGATNTYFDFSDVYIETLSADGNGVVFNGNDVPFTEVDFTYGKTDGTTVTATSLYVPHHGPVLSIDKEAGTAVSLKWTGNAMTTDVNFLTEMMRATTIEEGRQAALNVTSIGQNWVMIDTSGDIGWYPYNTVPIRPWADATSLPFLPLTGDGTEEWDGFYDYLDLPQTTNPAEGFVATANNDMTGANLDGNPANDGYPVLQSQIAAGYRHERIVDLLEETDQHTVGTMRDIIGDTYSLIGERTSPELLALVERDDLSTNAQALYDAMEAWQFTCPTGLQSSDPTSAASTDATEIRESKGCLAFHRVLGDSFIATFEDEAVAGNWARDPELEAFLRMIFRPEELRNPDYFWDDRTTTDVTEDASDIITAGFEAGATRLAAQEALGDDPSGWLWGRVHTTTLLPDLFSQFPGTGQYNSPTYSTVGGLYTVNVANPNLVGDSLAHSSGASMRLICEAPTEGVTCSVQLPGGQPHFRDDDGYLSLMDEWLENTPTPLIFDGSAFGDDSIKAKAPEEN